MSTPELRRHSSFPVRAFRFVVRELIEALPAIVLFAIGFNLIEVTTQLILSDYGVHFANFMVATMAALVVGKAVLVAKVLPFLGRFDTAPLVQPILFKSVVYWAMVLIARVLERIIEYLVGGGALADIPDYLATHFTWHRFAAVQIWIFVLFLIYTTFDELNSLFGHGELFRIFFTRPSSQLKLTRRRRVTALVRLNRLAETHGLTELRDPNTQAHGEMLELIGALTPPSGPPRHGI